MRGDSGPGVGSGGPGVGLHERAQGSSAAHPGTRKGPGGIWGSANHREGPGRNDAQGCVGRAQATRTPGDDEVVTHELHLREQKPLL